MPRPVPRPLQADYRPLGGVITTAEAAEAWNISRQAVAQAAGAGRIAARKAGEVWLIALDSAVRYWGLPLRPLEFDHEE